MKQIDVEDDGCAYLVGIDNDYVFFTGRVWLVDYSGDGLGHNELFGGKIDREEV